MIISVLRYVYPTYFNFRHQQLEIVHHEAFAAAHIENPGIRGQPVMIAEAAHGIGPKSRVIIIASVSGEPVTVKKCLIELSGDPTMLLGNQLCALVDRTLGLRIK